MPALSSYWGRVTLNQDARTLFPQMQRWVTLTRVINTLLFMYLQVHEYISFHICARWLAMRLSVASNSTLRRPSTEATKGVKYQHSLRQAWRYFFFFSRSAVPSHFSGILDR